jgi:activating signal cointegrator 1
MERYGNDKAVKIKGLSLWQPWASLMALGQGGKTIETRAWSTTYRGWVAIHAASAFSDKNMALASKPPFRGALVKGGYPNVGSLPLGCFVCLVDLRSIVSTDRLDPKDVPEREQYYGDYSPGRYAWFTETPIALKNHIPYQARQRLFDIDGGTTRAILDAIGYALPDLSMGGLTAVCPSCATAVATMSAAIAEFIRKYGCSTCRDKEADAEFSKAGIAWHPLDYIEEEKEAARVHG